MHSMHSMSRRGAASSIDVGTLGIGVGVESYPST